LCADFPAKCSGIHEVDESPLSVDLDHGQPFAVLGLEFGVAGDVHLVERLATLGEDGLGPFAEVAALRRVENDARYG
jgi:hypothetical protein